MLYLIFEQPRSVIIDDELIQQYVVQAIVRNLLRLLLLLQQLLSTDYLSFFELRRLGCLVSDEPAIGTEGTVQDYGLEDIPGG